jgi:hypothetical protein
MAIINHSCPLAHLHHLSPAPSLITVLPS